MFDFRYHALSLAAVFLALGIGIVLGVTVGDSLVSEADRNLRESLRGNVEDARREARDANRRLGGRDELIQTSFGALVGGRLRGERIGIVGFRQLPNTVESSSRRAVDDSGGTLDDVTVVPGEGERERVGEVLGGRFRRLGRDDDLLALAGRRIGRALARGGRLARELERAFPDEFDGDYRGADAFVYYEPPDDPRRPQDERDRDGALARGLVAGLKRGGRPVVGVEAADADPSQIGLYAERDLSSVDSIDTVGGRLALVLALDGERGAFGFKSSADRPIPDIR